MEAGLATDRWKRSPNDYLASARLLAASMERHGFLQIEAVPIDPNGDILDGSHRIGCAIALGLKAIPVRRETRYAWAPSWGYDWFLQHGMPHDDLARLCQDWQELNDRDDSRPSGD